MSEQSEPLAGTTIGPDGRRVPVEQVQTEDAAAVTDADGAPVEEAQQGGDAADGADALAPVTDVPAEELVEGEEIEAAGEAIEAVGEAIVTEAEPTASAPANEGQGGGDASANEGQGGGDAPANEGQGGGDAPANEGAAAPSEGV